MRTKLEFQADRIEKVLLAHQVPANVTGGTVTPRWIRFEVTPAAGAEISKIRGLSDELAASLGVTECRVLQDSATVSIEVARDDPQPVRLLPLYRQLTDPSADYYPIPPATAILGLAEDGAPLLARLPSPDAAHILVAGNTGAGKSTLLRSIITSLALINTPRDLRFLLIDHNGVLAPFATLPHLVRPMIQSTTHTYEALSSLAYLMSRRVPENGAEATTHPRIVVVIAEIDDTLMAKDALVNLTQRGRAGGIHIVAATSELSGRLFSTLVNINFPVRIVGRTDSESDARRATGWGGTGAEHLSGQGDFLCTAEERLIHFQAAHISADEIQTMMQQKRVNR